MHGIRRGGICKTQNRHHPGKELQIPNSKLQRSPKLQVQKPTCAPFVPVTPSASNIQRGTSNPARQCPIGNWMFDVRCSMFFCYTTSGNVRISSSWRGFAGNVEEE